MKLIPDSYQTPNAYVDLLMPYLDSDEWRVLSYAIRHILGWDDKIDARRRRMSISTFEHGVPGFAGCGLSHPTIVRVLGNLTKYNVLVKVGEPTSDGQMYELPIDTNQIDISGLQHRLEEKKLAAVKRTTKARQTKKDRKSQEEMVSPTNQQTVVSRINQQAVSPTNQTSLVPLTAGGMSDIPTQNQSSNPAIKAISQIQKSPGEIFIRKEYKAFFPKDDDIPDLIRDEVLSYGKAHSVEQIEHAFKQAKTYKGNSWAYIRQIFDNLPKPAKTLTGADFAAYADNLSPLIETETPVEPALPVNDVHLDAEVFAAEGLLKTPRAIWDAAMLQCSLQLDTTAYDTWFRDLVLADFHQPEGRYTVVARNQAAVENLRGRYHKTINRVLSACAGMPLLIDYKTPDQWKGLSHAAD